MLTALTQMTSDFYDFRSAMKEEYQEVYDKWSSLMETMESNTDEQKRESIKLLDEWMEMEINIHQMECDYVNAKLGAVIPQMVCKLRNELKADARERANKKYLEFERLRKDGVSFKEAYEQAGMKKVDREGYADWLNEPVHTLENTNVLSAENWLDEGTGYDKLKEIGITEFVNRNFMFMCGNKNNNE